VSGMTHIQPAVDAGHGYLSPSEVNHQPQAVTPRVKAVASIFLSLRTET